MRFLKIGSALVPILGLGFVVACSSSKGSSSASAPSTAGDAGVASGDSAAPGDPPTASAAVCGALIAFDQRCSDTAEMRSKACGDGRKTTCDAWTNTMGSAYRAAVTACYTGTVGCNDIDACMSEKLTPTQPTAAMLKVRDDYCATCGTEVGASCHDDFYKISKDEGNGDGFLVLQVSDAVAAAIDAKCTGSALHPADLGATTCRDGFLYCATNEQQNAGPGLPDSCFAPAPPDDGGTTDDGGTD